MNVFNFKAILRDPATFYYAIGAACCVIYAVNMYYTPIPLWMDAAHDDGHFVSQAQSIVAGHWLGPYNQMTLIKGPGYPLFLVLSHYSHVTYSVFLALFQAGSFVLLSFVIGRFARSPLLALVLLVVLLTFPWLWVGPVTRTLRDSIYTSCIFVFLSLWILAFWGEVRALRRLALLAGLSLGFISITREETPWLLPVLGFLIVASVFLYRWNNRSFRALFILCVFVAVGFGIVRAVVSMANYVKYGEFVVVDINEANFRQALAALFSVGSAERIDHVPLPRRSREAIYRISPSFAELRALLDADRAPLSGWQRPGCDAFGGPACSDYAYPWIMWAFRDAAAATGHYANAGAASEFYRNIAHEITSACQLGNLVCRGSIIAEMPPPLPGSFARMVTAVERGLAMISLAAPPPAGQLPSLDSSKLNAAGRKFLNGPIVAPTSQEMEDAASYKATNRKSVIAFRAIQNAIIGFYQLIWPACCLLSVLLLFAATIVSLKRRCVDLVLIMAWLFMTMAASRIIVLSFISGFMFNTMLFEYMPPASYGLAVAVVLSFYSFASVWQVEADKKFV